MTLATWALATWAQTSSAKSEEALLDDVHEHKHIVRWHATMVMNFLLQNTYQQIVFNTKPSFALIAKKQGGDGRGSLSPIPPNMFPFATCGNSNLTTWITSTKIEFEKEFPTGHWF